METAIDGAKLKYEIEQKGAYATIKLYVTVNGSNTYGDYAVKKLYGKNENDKAEMFLSANNYYAELNPSEFLLKYDTVEELIAFYSTQEGSLHYGVTTMEESVIQGQTLDTVYCEADSQPDIWNTDWCNPSRTVEWGCTR